MLNLFNSRRGIRVLMYHSIADTPMNDALTTSPKEFEKQIIALKKAGYSFISLAEMLEKPHPASTQSKRIVVTFDDGYCDQYDNAYPILQAYQVPATFFLPTAFLGDASRWDQDKAKAILSPQVLQTVDADLISLGLHTHQHINYEVESLENILKDLEQNMLSLQQQNLAFFPALAYPYGKRPRDPFIKKQLFEGMKNLGVEYGFRIGNRINYNLHNHPYEIQRIDVRGTDSHQIVMRKIRYGKII